MAGALHWVWLRVKNRVRQKYLYFRLRPKARGNFTRLGTRYGGWWVPAEVLKRGNVAFCVGVGEDASFDLSLMDFGLDVYSFDPTPRAIEYVHGHERAAEFNFLEVGLWVTDDNLVFYEPADPSFVSHSLVNIHGTEGGFVAPVVRYSTLIGTMLLPEPDVLKIDIEGAEHEVLRDILLSENYPSIILVEFDQPCSVKKICSTVDFVTARGYFVRKIEGWNVVLTRP